MKIEHYVFLVYSINSIVCHSDEWTYADLLSTAEFGRNYGYEWTYKNRLSNSL